MKPIIETNNLTKSYSGVNAVKGVSLNVNRGEIYGFLGLNGAGKTTTIRMLLGMIRPTMGAAYLNGKKVDAGNFNLWRDVGCLVETPYSYPELTVRENLDIARRLRHINDRSVVDSVMDELNITTYGKRKAGNLSLGNAQRLGLAKAMIHHPSILILDEPINGLDPKGIVEVRKLLQNLAMNRGVTIFISSHILGEISKLANRVGIIHDGRLIQEVDSAQLNLLRRKRLLLNALNQNAAKSKLQEAGFSTKRTEEGILETDNEEAVRHPERIAGILAEAGLFPTLLKVEEEDLESYFLRAIGTTEGKVS